MTGNIKIVTMSLSDVSIGYSLAASISAGLARAVATERYAVPIDEISGASIGFTFGEIQKIRDHVGVEWMGFIFAGLDRLDPEVIRSMFKIGLRGAEPETILDVLPLQRAAELIAAALILRIKGVKQ